MTNYNEPINYNAPINYNGVVVPPPVTIIIGAPNSKRHAKIAQDNTALRDFQEEFQQHRKHLLREDEELIVLDN